MSLWIKLSKFEKKRNFSVKMVVSEDFFLVF